MARSLEEKHQWLRDQFKAYLRAQNDTTVVTRHFINHYERPNAEVTPGLWTIVAGSGSGFDQETDIDFSLRGGRHQVAIIYQCLVAESASGAELEQHINAAYERLIAWLKLGSCNLYFSEYRRCEQLEHPYGWLAASLYFTE